MLTSYMVKCPHPGCDWFGSLLPRNNSRDWHCAVPSSPVVTFRCPKCERGWQARVHGDDVETLPLDTTAAVVA